MQTVERDGPQALTVRALARDLGLSQNALYWHYPSRTALLEAVIRRGLEELLDQLKNATPQAKALSDLLPVAETYLQFAQERPKLYALMTSPVEDSGMSRPLWTYTTDLLAPFVGADRAPEAAVALWSYLHGAASLRPLLPLKEGKPESGLHLGLQALIRGLGALSESQS
ncbi:hypothetical protein DC3_20070 [Deinococcus cellulosilyticus NBRC 106333 = KACC 11606]|uniref:HTH tetR-type domain-containing protein n=1 Tax=Deinococcus cellulosilyticus (strain DSM 18568 / NBRC 106333 / KACC 11606 / 5516J-15) TaxID=1223518 RepID=A0A511N0I9_DEIC1|nr:hypothetical protein DC3_20070 [Deinococcus cellulosilyticus NBRC 106333 = KACC 11606]